MLDRTIAPSFKEIKHIDIARAKSSALDNGVPFHIIQSGTENVVRLELVFDAGHWFEPDNGVSFFTTKLLTAGTSTLSAGQIEERIAQYGAFIDVVTGYDRATIVLYALSKHLANLLPLILELVKDSVFPEEEIDNLKQITLQNYKVNLKKTSFIASSHFRESLFGKDHPYSRTVDEQAINRVTRENIQRYYQERFSSSNLNIFLSGNGPEDFYGLVNQTFGKTNWGKKAGDIPRVQAGPVSSKNILIPKEDSVQSSIRMGTCIFPISHPDYFKMNLLTEILGGYFGSRLMKNIREEKGYTYGISASIHSLKHAGYLIIATDVNKENTQNTINEIQKEIQILKTEPVKEDELTTVRNYLLGSFVSSITTPFGLADRFKTLYFHGLTYDFYEEYAESLRKITPDDLMSTANKYLTEDVLLEVVAGGK